MPRKHWEHLHTFPRSQRLWRRGSHYYLADESGDDYKGTPDDTDDGPLRIETRTPTIIGPDGALVPVIVERGGHGGCVLIEAAHALILSTMVPGLTIEAGRYEWSISLVDRTHLIDRDDSTRAVCGLRKRFRHTPQMTAKIDDVTCAACLAEIGDK